MILDLVIAPDDRLSLCSEKVKLVDDNIKTLLKDMMQTMRHDRGVGLAAVQVGIHKRVFVMDVPENMNDDDDKVVDKTKNDYLAYGGPYFIVNPEIIELSEEKILMCEGCLSVPEQKAIVERPKFVVVKFLDENGKKETLKAQGWLARCIQHENDHLNGLLYIEHLSKLKYEMAIKKAKNLKVRNIKDS